VKIFNCWLTVLLASYQDQIVAGLVRKGYMVGALSKDRKATITAPNSPTAIICLSLYKALDDGDLLDAHIVYTDLRDILTTMKAYFYSIVVSETSDCAWCGSNFVFLENEEKTAEKKSLN